MQNVTSTAIDLFGPCNCSQNGGDLKSDPEKVRKSGTQKLASSHSHQLDRTPRALSVTGWYFRNSPAANIGETSLTRWFFQNPPLGEAGRPAVGFSTIGGKVARLQGWIINMVTQQQSDH